MAQEEIAGGTAHKLPDDMRKSILADKRLMQMWEDITPLARNEWICWTTTVTKPETRVKHIKGMRDKMLKKGMRRPCCWAGCLHRTDKALSPSQKWVLKQTNRS